VSPKKLFFITLIMLILVGGGSVIHAQGQCFDAAGGVIPCPTQPFLDRDSDTVDDANDMCPDVPGDPNNRGCPVEQTGATATPAVSVPLPAFPTSGRCLIATYGETVNIRQAPNVNAPVVGQLNPGDFLVVLNKTVINGELWYRTPLGYVLGSVVRASEACDRVVPTIESYMSAGKVSFSDLSLMPGSGEAPPPPEFDCEYYIIVDGSVVCLVTIPPVIIPMPGGTEGAPPPDSECFYQVLVDGTYICLIREEPRLTALLPGGTEAPPPDDGGCLYQVLVDGSFICLIGEAPQFAAPGGSPQAPPPDDGTCFYQVLVDGSFICLIPEEPNFAIPGGSEAPPPPEPGPCYHLIITPEGQAICLVTIPPMITLDPGTTEAPPPPEPDTCYRLVITPEGQAYCLVTIPPVISLAPDPAEGAPPPDPFDCARYVLINGTMVCLIPEAVNEIAAMGGGSENMPQTREHILLAFDPPSVEECPQTAGMLLPAVQKVRAAAARLDASLITFTGLEVLPPADPCAIEMIFVNPDVPPTPTPDGGIELTLDVVRVIPPTTTSSIGDFDSDGDVDGSDYAGATGCYAGNGIIGCTVGFGGYSFSAWYDAETGGHTETCVPVGENGVSCE